MISSSVLLKRLAELRLDVSENSEAYKCQLIKQLAKRPPATAVDLLEFYEILLFLAAFPSSESAAEIAASALKTLDRLFLRRARQSKKFSEAIANTGVAGSRCDSPLSLSASGWLLSSFPSDTQLPLLDDKSDEEWGNLLRECTWLPHADAVLYEDLSTKEIAKLAASSSGAPQWITELAAGNYQAEVFATALFEKNLPTVNWQITAATSRAAQKIEIHQQKQIFCHQELRKSYQEIPSILARKLPAPTKLSSSKRSELIKLVRTCLYSRGRETDPVAYTSPTDVTLFHLESGICVILLGSVPSRRRPLESFIGYLATKNGYPIAYGGAWMLGEQADIGVNIFDTFRGGESAFLFAQLLRVYHQHFGVQNFEVEPYQFGKDNDEAIQSGAFWFYWRLGFRPVRPALHDLASNEWSKISQQKGYRTPKSKLRKLASDRIRLEIGSAKFPSSSTQRISVYAAAVGVLAFVRSRFKGNWDAAFVSSQQQLCAWLDIRSLSDWSASELSALRRLAIYLAWHPEIRHWPKIEKQLLVKLIRAKGQETEREYQLLLLRSTRIKSLLRSLAARGARVAR